MALAKVDCAFCVVKTACDMTELLASALAQCITQIEVLTNSPAAACHVRIALGRPECVGNVTTHCCCPVAHKLHFLLLSILNACALCSTCPDDSRHALCGLVCRQFYILIGLRDWIMNTEVDAYRCGRVFEYTWHMIFGEPAQLSPVPECELLTCGGDRAGRLPDSGA